VAVPLKLTLAAALPEPAAPEPAEPELPAAPVLAALVLMNGESFAMALGSSGNAVMPAPPPVMPVVAGLPAPPVVVVDMDVDAPAAPPVLPAAPCIGLLPVAPVPVLGEAGLPAWPSVPLLSVLPPHAAVSHKQAANGPTSQLFRIFI
jgi:hypothetical protein